MMRCWCRRARVQPQSTRGVALLARPASPAPAAPAAASPHPPTTHPPCARLPGPAGCWRPQTGLTHPCSLRVVVRASVRACVAFDAMLCGAAPHGLHALPTHNGTPSHSHWLLQHTTTTPTIQLHGHGGELDLERTVYAHTCSGTRGCACAVYAHAPGCWQHPHPRHCACLHAAGADTTDLHPGQAGRDAVSHGEHGVVHDDREGLRPVRHPAVQPAGRALVLRRPCRRGCRWCRLLLRGGPQVQRLPLLRRHLLLLLLMLLLLVPACRGAAGGADGAATRGCWGGGQACVRLGTRHPIGMQHLGRGVCAGWIYEWMDAPAHPAHQPTDRLHLGEWPVDLLPSAQPSPVMLHSSPATHGGLAAGQAPAARLGPSRPAARALQLHSSSSSTTTSSTGSVAPCQTSPPVSSRGSKGSRRPLLPPASFTASPSAATSTSRTPASLDGITLPLSPVEVGGGEGGWVCGCVCVRACVPACVRAQLTAEVD